MSAAANALPGGDHAMSTRADAVPREYDRGIDGLPRHSDPVSSGHHYVSSTGHRVPECRNHLPNRTDAVSAAWNGLHHQRISIDANCVGRAGASVRCAGCGMPVTNDSGREELTLRAVHAMALTSGTMRGGQIMLAASFILHFPGWESR